MNDLRTREGALRFAELRRAEMLRLFEQRGRFEVNGVATAAYVLITHRVVPPRDMSLDPDGWSTGERYPKVVAVPVTVPPLLAAVLAPADLSSIFGETVRRYATLGRAVGVVLMSEQWWGLTKTLDEREALPDRVRDWPDRREVLYLKLEHEAVGTVAWYAEIKRDGAVRVEEWRDAGVWLGGNLGDFLPGKVAQA